MYDATKEEVQPLLYPSLEDVEAISYGDALSPTGRSMLNTQKSMVTRASSLITTTRIFALAAAMIIAVLGTSFLDPKSFEHPVHDFDIIDKHDCRLECESRITRKGWHADCDKAVFKVKHEKALSKSRSAPIVNIKKAECTFEIYPPWWAPYLVIDIALISIIAILGGMPADIVFLVDCLFFGLMKVICASCGLEGFASGAVLTIGALMAAGAAIEEIGWLDVVLGAVMGSSGSMTMGLLRMMFAGAAMSMVLPNAALLLLFSPVLSSWCTQQNFPKRKFFAPLGIALQLGGQATLLGSATPMVAKSILDPKVYNLGMFDLTPVGLATALPMIFACALAVPLLPDGTAEHVSNDADDASAQQPSGYGLAFVIQAGAGYDGADAQDVCDQLRRIEGVVSAEAEAQGALSAGSRILCWCTGEGVTCLRRYSAADMVLVNHDDLMLLGTHRRKRHLYEAVVHDDSPLVGVPFNVSTMMLKYRGCLVTIRSKIDLGASIVPGDILLLEAEDAAITSNVWAQSFSMVKMVPGSSPSRMGTGAKDTLRAVFVVLGFAGMVVAIAMGVDTTLAAFSLVAFYLAIDALSVEQMFGAIKFRGLLIIVGCMGLAKALQEAGVAHMMVRKLLQAARPLGSHGIRAAIYILGAGLSTLVSKTATIAILTPMLPEIARDANVSVQSMVWTAIFAAGACYITPFGEPATIFIMKDGGYSFGDLAKYGLPLQIIHGVVTVALVALFCDVLKL